MKFTLIGALSLVMLFGLSAVTTPSSCSLVILPGRQSGETAFLLASPQSDTAFIGVQGMPVEMAGMLDDPELPPDSVWAQAFTVHDIVGRGAPLLTERGKDFRAYLIPWGYNAACDPVHWTGPAEWVTPNGEGVHSVWLRPRSAWVNDTPTFDVPYAWEQPYSPTESAGRDGGKNGYITVREFFEVAKVLTEAPDSAAAVEAYDEWLDEHPDAEKKFPIILMDEWRRTSSGAPHFP